MESASPHPHARAACKDYPAPRRAEAGHDLRTTSPPSLLMRHMLAYFADAA